jgi:hypothetical protein
MLVGTAQRIAVRATLAAAAAFALVAMAADADAQNAKAPTPSTRRPATTKPAAPVAPKKTAQSSKRRRRRGVITLAEVTITGRIQKPIAAVDVSRIRPKLTLSELRQPFLDRIGKAVYKAPF